MTPRKPPRSQWAFALMVAISGFGMLVLISFWPDYHQPIWERILMTLFIGPLCGFGLAELMKVVRMRQFWHMAKHLPQELQLEQQDDGSFVAFVTQLDGQPRIIRLPEDYDPREDPRQLFEILSKPD